MQTWVSKVSQLALWALILIAPPLQADEASDLEQMSGRAFEGAQWVMATQAARAVAQMEARAATGDGTLARLIRNRFPEYADIANPKPLGYAALRPYLAPNEGLVLFLSTPGATYIWAVSHSGVAWHCAAVTAADLSDRVRSLRIDLDPTGPARAATPLNPPTSPLVSKFDVDGAHGLFIDLLKPVIHVLDNVDHLFVEKNDPLSSLPLAVLLTARPPDDLDLATAPWLIRTLVLTTLPGASSLSSIRTNKIQTAPRRAPQFVGFGDPDFQNGTNADDAARDDGMASRSIDAFFDGGVTRLDAFRRSSPLPETSRELNQIAKLFAKVHVTIITGARATEVAVKSAPLSTATIVLFATHGLVTGIFQGWRNLPLP